MPSERSKRYTPFWIAKVKIIFLIKKHLTAF